MDGYRVIHTLEEHHLPDLMQLYKGEWWSRDRTVEQVRQLLEASDLVVGVCEEAGGHLVGFARVLTDRVFRAMIYDVIVAADHRGCGVGHRLMKAVLANPIVKGVEHVELYCRPELMPFYESLGFSAPTSGVLLMRRSARNAR